MRGGDVGGRLDRGGHLCHEPGDVSMVIEIQIVATYGVEGRSVGGRHLGDLNLLLNSDFREGVEEIKGG